MISSELWKAARCWRDAEIFRQEQLHAALSSCDRMSSFPTWDKLHKLRDKFLLLCMLFTDLQSKERSFSAGFLQWKDLEWAVYHRLNESCYLRGFWVNLCLRPGALASVCPTGLTGARAHIPRKCWVTGTCSGQLKALRRELKTPSEWRQWQRQWQSQVKWVKWVKSLSPVIPFSKHSQQPAQPPWQNVQNVDLTEPFATSVRCLHLLTGFRASFHTCLRLDEVPYCSCRAGCACHVAVCSSRARLWVDFQLCR